jgi:carbamate kinase
VRQGCNDISESIIASKPSSRDSEGYREVHTSPTPRAIVCVTQPGSHSAKTVLVLVSLKNVHTSFSGGGLKMLMVHVGEGSSMGEP